MANLLGSDPDGIFIGLTGTPILKEEFKTTDLFNGYIHKYYYNKSVADGYTLKIKKENISTEFKRQIHGVLNIKEGRDISSVEWENATKEPEFVSKLGQYIVKDFNIFRNEIYSDKTLGCMIVTSSSEQARMIQDWFGNNSDLKTALILHDEEGNKTDQEEFRGKKNKNDQNKLESKLHGVVVYNILLTGFDAPRLKRIYLLRRIREHSLLQTLARVNRPYKNMKYGYVVDFVDITEEYEITNKRYLDELRGDLFDLDENLDIKDVVIDIEQIQSELRLLNNKLFIYIGNIEDNLEEFQKQIHYYDESKLRELKSDLGSYKDIYNELRISHCDVSSIPIKKIERAFLEVSNRLSLKIC